MESVSVPGPELSDSENRSKRFRSSGRRIPRLDGPAPAVTVGIPVYNGERFLSQALQSLRDQTFEDTEIVISDNVSTDRTPEICQDHAASDPRIRYIRRTEHVGAPGNWNFVAEHARGKYLKWSSANDYCARDHLKKCVAVLEADPTVVVCQTRTLLVDEEEGTRKEYEGDVSATQDRPSERFRVMSRCLALNNLQSGVIRLDALRRTKMDRPYQGGDRVLMAELALQGRIVLLPEALFFRRVGRDTVSARLSQSELRRFLDPQGKQRPGLDEVRLFMDYVRTVSGASIGFREKLRTLKLIGEQACWDRKTLLRELLSGLGTRKW